MDEHACANCGAQNRDDAAYCWRCYTPVGRTSAPVAMVPARAGASRSTTVGEYGGGNGSGMRNASPSSPVGTTRETSSMAWLFRAVLFVAAFAGGWLLVNHFFFSGFPFPDQIAGHQRVDSQNARDAAETITAFGQAFDMEMETAFYGSEVQPEYMMFVFEMPEGLPMAGSQPFTGAAGPVPFTCQEQVEGASCFWSGDDGKFVGLGGFGKPAADVEPVARRVQAELQA
jgi:hypothetical protein